MLPVSACLGHMTNSPPLSGLRVLELARVLAGPWIGQTLADLGATVIKVESPAGDETRAWGPPFAADGAATYFHSCNRGKRSIALDFRNPDDLAVAKDLAQEADIVVENFKLGGLVKYGLDYASLSAENVGLIYCSITGFGQTGPNAHLPGYDFIIQAMSGVMDVTGQADGPPVKTGIALADLFTAMYGVVGIQTALIQRQKTGRGQHIDMALFDSLTCMLANQATSFLSSGTSPSRLGNTHPSIVPYQVFDASDGPLVIACGNDGQFARLCKVLAVDWNTDARFATNPERLINRDVLVPMLADLLIGHSRAELLAMMEKAGVPAGPINTVGEALTSEQTIARNLVHDLENSRSVKTPIVFSDMAQAEITAPPELDADGAAIRKDGWRV